MLIVLLGAEVYVLLWGMSVLWTLQREGEPRVVPLLRGRACLLKLM